MKKTISILLLFICLKGIPQNEDTIGHADRSFTMNSFELFEQNEDSVIYEIDILFDADSLILIYGDTIKAIRSLFKSLLDSQNKLPQRFGYNAIPSSPANKKETQ